MTVKEAYQQLLLQLYTLYDDREAANIADLVIEHVTGQRKIDRIIFKTLAVDELQQKVLENISFLVHLSRQKSKHNPFFLVHLK